MMKTPLILLCLAMAACAPDHDWKENDASGHMGTMTRKGPPTPVTSPTYGPTRGPMVNPNAGMR